MIRLLIAKPFIMNNNSKNIIVCLLLSSAVLAGCLDYGYFGLSNEANILAFELEGQQSNVIEQNGDWNEEGRITITVPDLYDLAALKVSKATCTQLARFNIDPYILTDFSQPVELRLTAEDTTIRKRWIITVLHDKASDQLPFAKMNQWTPAIDSKGQPISYKEGELSKSAYFPGNGTALSPWQSPAEANAFSLSGINTLTTTPRPAATTAEYARIETIWVKSTQTEKAHAQIVTGALFTGKFFFSMTYAPLIGTGEPRKMLQMGVPFYARPQAAVFQMRFQPGDVMRDGTGTPITASNADGRPLKDSCEVYILLHNRQTADTYIRVASAQLRVGEPVGDMNNDASGFVEITIPFTYGRPDVATLAAKPYMKIGGCRGELTFYKFPVDKESQPVTEIYAENPDAVAVDHISILFSSSTYGDFFWGAVNEAGGKFRGSTLDIKDFRLTY